MLTINNTVSVYGPTIELDNGWRVDATSGVAVVRKPLDAVSGDKEKGAVAANFDSIEERIVWAAGGGEADSTDGVRFKPS